MTEILDIPSLQPILPELILALGAMALLMLGVARGDTATPSVSGLAIFLLVFGGQYQGSGDKNELAAAKMNRLCRKNRENGQVRAPRRLAAQVSEVTRQRHVIIQRQECPAGKPDRVQREDFAGTGSGGSTRPGFGAQPGGGNHARGRQTWNPHYAEIPDF